MGAARMGVTRGDATADVVTEQQDGETECEVAYRLGS